jgi:hypothetical protein
MVVKLLTPELAAVDADLGRRLAELETARARLQAIDYRPLADPALGHRLPEVLALWDRLRLTIADVLAALLGEE